MGSMNAPPPLDTILRQLRFQTPHFQILIQTFLPDLPSPSSTTLSLHLKFSAGSRPLIPLHTLQVSKPPQSSSPNYLCHTLNTQMYFSHYFPLIYIKCIRY